jgi:Ca2+-binding RTX toxin-like protein
MDIVFSGVTPNFFSNAFFDGGSYDVTVISSNSKKIVLEQPATGQRTVITGTGLVYDGTGALVEAGTITGIRFASGGGGAVLASFGDMAWDMATLHAGLTAAAGGDDTILNGLFSGQPVTLDLTAVPGLFRTTNLDPWVNDYVTTYIGSGRSDRIHAGDNLLDRLVDAGHRHDVVITHGGNDTLIGGAGRDTLYSGDGNDWLDGGVGNDTMDGGNGKDILYGGKGMDVLYGGSGGDILYGGKDSDWLYGESSYLYPGGGNDILYGGGGNDFLFGGSGHDTMYGGSGDDYLRSQSGKSQMHGGQGNDSMLGSNVRDSIWGDDGSDTIYGAGGADLIFGGRGRDEIFGSHGPDTIWGDDGSDTIYGGYNNDLIFGGRGRDDIYGGTGNDVIYAGSDSRDETDNSKLYGEKGSDQLYGAAGHDRLSGGNGNDRLSGGDGNDTLYGGLGNDTLIGDGGADSFRFYRFGGNDLIWDFQNDIDILRLDDKLWGGGLTEAQVIATYADDTGGVVVFEFTGGEMIMLLGFATKVDLIDDLVIV